MGNINPCKICGKSPLIFIDVMFWHKAICRTFQCKNDAQFGKTKKELIKKWNEAQCHQTITTTYTTRYAMAKATR